MATTDITLIQRPCHEQHPLELVDFSKDTKPRRCHLCKLQISVDGYACLECMFYVHRVCVEAPSRIHSHPLHTHHPLILLHHRPPFYCDACGEHFAFSVPSFRCDECDFDLDIYCALYALSDPGDFHGKTQGQIKLPLHIHTLTTFCTNDNFIVDKICVICKARVEGDWYMCMNGRCEFHIHKRCIQDLQYADGTKAPTVYHGHPLETFVGEDMGSTRCVLCRFDAQWGEFIGCTRCEVFIHRDCAQVPDIIQYPRHQDHSLVLLIDYPKARCDSCSLSITGELFYGCPSCEFFVDVGCALHVLAYCEEGMSAKIELSWHQHPLYLCHRYAKKCSYCEDESDGPVYVCKEEDCPLLLHQQCTEIESRKSHPHHPDHPLTLCHNANFSRCEACAENINYLLFSCELCEFYLHAKCAAHVPTRKHPLHEHKLLHLEKAQSGKCNICDTELSSPFFRCVLCDFNLHAECMEELLPPKVVNTKVHWHPLTLHETYVEDDSGEYYCDLCEETRDERLGAYVCLYCSGRWVYHIECVFPEHRNLFVKDNTFAIENLTDEIARREEDVRNVETNLEQMKLELNEKRKILGALIVKE